MALPENENGPEQVGPVIRDKRRIDPETGELRTPEEAEPAVQPAGQPTEQEAAVGEVDELGAVRQELAERTADLQRLQAEYANYRKRVDRDRTAVRDQALAQVLGELVPVLDDIGRAREHDELTGGFKSVGESLEGLVGKLGLKRFAQEGDVFDPNVHEALTMLPTPGIEVPTIIEVFQPGYRVGDRIVRPARVVVGGPAEEVEIAEAAPPAAEAPPEPAADAAAEPEVDTGEPADGSESDGAQQ